MLAIVLGLSSSLCWGLADFAGGVQSRRLSVIAVMLVSQAAGLAALVVIVAVSGESLPEARFLVYAALAGSAGAVALSAFYRALAIGTMSIVAPISATAAVVPVIVGLATGERPGALQVAGMATAVAGVILVSRELDEHPAGAVTRRLSIGLALFAALGFGSFFVAMDRASSASVLWALVTARGASVVVLAAFTGARRPQLALRTVDLPALAAIGAFDVLANACYAYATTKGLLSVVAVLGSLYPLTTVLLARALLGERVRRIQELGIAATLLGVALIAAG